MKTTITFRHMQPSEALKGYVNERLTKLDRYVRNSAEAHVILNVEKSVHSAEVVVASKGVRAQGRLGTQDMYASIDGAIEKVEKTLKRHHDKRITAKSQAGKAVELL